MQASERDPGYFGWRVVAAASICLMLGFALYACTFSVFLKPLAAEFHWSRGTISTGFALSALAVAIFSPLTGQWMDRRSPRPALIFGVTGFSFAFLCLGGVATVWQFYLLCFLLGCVGNNVQMGYTQLISAWFETRRGLAMGVMLAGEGVGLIVFPPLANNSYIRLGGGLPTVR